MNSWFQRRGYPEDVKKTEMVKMFFSIIFCQSSNKDKSVSFVLTYYPLLKKVN